MNSHSHPRGFLIDLDGVVYIQEQLIPGSIATIHALQQRRIPHRFVTNTSTISRRQLLQRLSAVGLDIPAESLFTAPLAAARYLAAHPGARCFFFTTPDVLEDFEGIGQAGEHPTHVVIGDAGEGFTYDALNRVFRMIMDGAEMLAFQKNRYWLTRDGLTLDAGAFIAALEYASGKSALVFGKPSAQFFHEACLSLGLQPADVAMVGDDLVADIRGAQDAGLNTVFVQTGKDRKSRPEEKEIHPTHILPSLAELHRLFSE